LRRRRPDRIQKHFLALEAAMKGAPAEDPEPAFYDRVAVVQQELRRSKKRRR
jgi:hypothetical protein